MPSASALAGPARSRLALICVALAAGVAACVVAPVAHAVPTASFGYSPGKPLSQTRVTFTSTAAPGADGAAIALQAWELDGDGLFDEGAGPSTSRTYPSPGRYTVSLKVVDVNGGVAFASAQVPVGNRRPKPAIAFSPSTPQAGDVVSFFSTSVDQDGYIASQRWDLDHDGSFDDGSATLASRIFPVPGEYIVGLRVVDNSGSAADAQVTVTVLPPGAALLHEQSAGRGGVSATGLLSPFPLVRIAGLVRRGGVVLRLLSVQAPVGTTVQVRCRGRGCPFKSQTRNVSARKSASGVTQGTRVLKIKRFRRALLRTGAIVRVLVSRPDAIGKYTRFRIRSGRLPARVDRCLMPDGRTPIRCP